MLDLSDNHLVAIPSYAFQVFSDTCTVPVAYLHLSQNNIHSFTGNYTFPFGKSPNLSELYLDSNKLGSEFFQTELNLPHLLYLSIEDNDIEYFGIM